MTEKIRGDEMGMGKKERGREGGGRIRWRGRRNWKERERHGEDREIKALFTPTRVFLKTAFSMRFGLSST